MTKEEVIELNNTINSIDIKAIKQSLIQIYSESEYNSTLVSGTITPHKIYITTNKAIKNFKEAINNGVVYFLPRRILWAADQPKDIITSFNNIKNLVKSNSFDRDYVTNLNIVVAYEMQFGLWEKNIVEYNQLSEEELDKLTTNLYQQKKSIDETTKRSKELMEILDKNIANIGNLVNEKNREFETITSNLQKSIDLNNKISNALTNSSVTEEKINSIFYSIDRLYKDASQNIKTQEGDYKNLSEKLNSRQKTLDATLVEVETINKNYNEKLNKIVDDETYIKSKKNEIDELTGFAAGVSLFHTFQERKNQLKWPVYIWLGGVVVATGLTILALWLIFKHYPLIGNNGITDWGKFAVNTLKSFPTVILLYFTINQYSKERLFQEEYAFKSAVALTINAYADKLSNEHRDALILSAVEKVYQAPNSMREKMRSMVGFRTKDLAATIKNLNDTLSQLKKSQQ